MHKYHLPLKQTVALCLLLFVVSQLRVQAQDASPYQPAPYGSNLNKSYVRTWEAVAPIQDPNVLMTKGVREVRQTTQYVDGLGRPLQVVVKAGSLPSSGSPGDLVTAVEYDAFGREVRQYLPFASATVDGSFRMNPFEQQANFYNEQINPNSPVKGQGETYYYGKTEFEASPLNRVVRQYAPGNSWVGSGGSGSADRGVKTHYGTNEPHETVLRIWNISSAPGSLPTTPGVYPPGELYRVATQDESDHYSFEYKDKEGRVVCKSVQNDNGWLITFYVYDDLGQLRCVIPPKAVTTIWADWQMTPQVMDELCFRYEYDERGRMIQKKVPGAAEVHMVYDARDRLVMTQDGNQRTTQPYPKWSFTQYDELNRPIKTGILGSAGSRADHQAAAYNSTAYPNYGNYAFDILTETHYDNYDDLPGGLSAALDNSGYAPYFFSTYNASPSYAQEVKASSAVKGKVTWTKTRILGGGWGDMLGAVYLYDDRGRVIQVQSHNHTWQKDVVTTQYDFSGRVLNTHVLQNKGGSNYTTIQLATRNSYDDLGRLTRIEKNLNNLGWKTITQNEYDALGQLKSKKLGTNPSNSNGALETSDYAYNIRGWLLGVNRDYAKSATSTSNFFGFDLGYDKKALGAIGAYAAEQLGGNIAGTVWKSKGDGRVRRYDFSYDWVNRLTAADFNQLADGGFSKVDGVDFSVSGLSYDENGNILRQTQRGLKGVSSQTIDSLVYTYLPNSNKLQGVVDRVNDTETKLGDFRSSKTYLQSLAGSKTTAAVDYAYDVNGNLVQDLNKDIKSAAGGAGITYNHLNLPVQITTPKGNITYSYDAMGTKLKKVVSEAGQPTRTTLYVGGAVYENDTLQFISHEEGRIRYQAGSNSFAWDYFLKDHLGNVRMVLTEEASPAAIYQASMEESTRGVDTALFSGISETAADKPAGFDSDGSNQKVSKLFASSAQDKRVGPGVVLKVMAGDRFTARAQGWYLPNATDVSEETGLTPLVNALVSALSGGLPLQSLHEGSGAGATSSGLNSSLRSFLDKQQSQYTPNNSAPKAYLNWVVLDEAQFRLVEGNYGATQMPLLQGTEQKQVLQAAGGTPIEIKKNGYLYVYLSNESKGSVYFDDLRVEHTKGALLEETHYYPFGLTMQGISSKAVGELENKKEKFQGQEFANELGLDYYEFKYRTHDPQIGRFVQVDPLSSDYVYNSTYAFSENKVTNHIELEGLEAVPAQKQKQQNEFEKNENKNKETNTNTTTIGGYTFKPKVTLTLNVGAVAAAEVEGVGAQAGMHGVDFIGWRDNEFFFAGQNLDGEKVNRTYAEGGVVIAGGGKETKNITDKGGNKYKTETIKFRTFGFVTTEVEENKKTGEVKQTSYFDIGAALGLGMVVEGGLKFVFYESVDKPKQVNKATK